MIEGYRGVYELSADGMTGGFALSRGCAAQDVTVR